MNEKDCPHTDVGDLFNEALDHGDGDGVATHHADQSPVSHVSQPQAVLVLVVDTVRLQQHPQHLHSQLCVVYCDHGLLLLLGMMMVMMLMMTVRVILMMVMMIMMMLRLLMMVMMMMMMMMIVMVMMLLLLVILMMVMMVMVMMMMMMMMVMMMVMMMMMMMMVMMMMILHREKSTIIVGFSKRVQSSVVAVKTTPISCCSEDNTYQLLQ